MKCPFCNNNTADQARLCAHCGKDIQKSHTKLRNISLCCPTCKVQTSKINLASIELDFCHECSGIWFDKKEMAQFQKVISQEQSADEIYTLLNEMALGKERKQRGSYLECPVCNDLMIQRNYLEISGILLDQCLQHGTWADKQDLVSILDMISTGDFEELLIKASNKRLVDLEKRVKELELEEAFVKADISRINRNQKTHLALDILGIL